MATNAFDLSDHVAVVTGAGRGIGEGIAKTYARAGAAVVLAARRTDPETQRQPLIADPLAVGHERLVKAAAMAVEQHRVLGDQIRQPHVLDPGGGGE